MSKTSKNPDTILITTTKLIEPTFVAMKRIGNHATIIQIRDTVAEILNLPENVLNISHLDTSQSEFEYNLAWARTALRKSGIIVNEGYGVWSISPKYANVNELSKEDLELAKKKKQTPSK